MAHGPAVFSLNSVVYFAGRRLLLGDPERGIEPDHEPKTPDDGQ